MGYFILLMCVFALTAPTLGQQLPQQGFNPAQTQPGAFPNQNIAQPGMNQNMNPGMGQPGMNPVGNQGQPGMVQNQPGMVQNQPGMVQNQPGMVQNQPGMVQNQPQQPGTVNQAPNQQPGQENNDFTCNTAGRAAVAQCFQQNGGFQMGNVIALLSNGTQGQLPANSEQLKAQLCQAEKQISSCVFSGIVRYNGTQQCATVGAFVRLQQETVGLLNGIQQMCGTGIIPRVTTCMRRLSYDMVQCYEKVGLNPALYTPGGSRMEGAVIGDNREAASIFCTKRRELFTCQNKLLDDCPGALDLQELSGNDPKSMQQGMDVLCGDIDDYVSGLVCFQEPPPAVQTCASDLVREMADVTMSQLRDGLSVDAFFVQYCMARIRNLRCDNKAWNGKCKPVVIGIKSEFQCTLLPSRCKKNPQVRDLYQTVCTPAAFGRNLRNTDNGATSMWAGLTTLMTSIGFFAFMLI